MKKETLAKRIGYKIMNEIRVPYLNKVGDITKSPKNHHLIRLKHVSTYAELSKYYNISVKPQYRKLRKAILSKSSKKSYKNVFSPNPDKKNQ